MPIIFISYRRDDSAETATILHERLKGRFSPENVFFDVEDIKPGDTFPERIRTHLDQADVVLAVVGPGWIEDDRGNRWLEDSSDWVALELRTALELDKRIIPILVGDAPPLEEETLPDPLRQLAKIQAHSISPRKINPDITALIGFIEEFAPGTEPEGAITFLFTDIEGSSAKWEQHLEEMRLALEHHDEIIEEAVQKNGGDLFAESGDGVSTAFHSPVAALQAALDGQRALQAEPWGAVDDLKVRMSIHTGAPQRRHGNYFGPTLNRTARLLELANGGQILVSNATQELVHDRLPSGASLQDRETQRLRSLSRPEHVFQLSHPQLESVDTPLRTKTLPRRHLPRHLPRFIGRGAQVTRARELLGESQLMTLTGVGGVGKTRLSLAVAESYDLADYADGIHLARLETVKQAKLVIRVVADALGIRERSGQSTIDLVVGELTDRNFLSSTIVNTSSTRVRVPSRQSLNPVPA